ncbi:hypothetical protein [Micromonospora sp. NPDC049679]|uniref:hypothetical protein n=1 Tax=Micromonospora sp. NPDC049679 TaxID=3155920 RepID=UPI0033CB9AD9
MPLQDGWHLAEPLITFAVVGVLAAALWWMFWPQPRPSARVGADDDFGLLEVAAYADQLVVAIAVRRFLAHAGIRSTHATDLDARIRILVFAEDLQRARNLVRRAQDEPDGFTSPWR